MKTRSILIRRCIGCNERRHKSELIRICKKSDNAVYIDLTYKMEGRGVYICRDNPECLEKSIKFNKFHRSLKVDIPLTIISKLQDQIDKT